MEVSRKWNYDYDTRCECSEDDRCGCAFPENMARSFVPDYQTQTQQATLCRPVLVGQQAFNFSAPAVFADGSTNDLFNFFDYIADSYALLVFYLADFSAVCPLDITSFNQAYAEFSKRNIKVVAVSVDSLPAHIAWRKLPFAEGGIGQVGFPLVSDLSKVICNEYGVLRSDGMAQRSTFLIDKSYTVKYQAVYDHKIERSVEETLRVADRLISLDKSDCKGFQCWNKQNKPAVLETSKHL
ncbi:MAG: redoxin domain-containing protein [Alphaproteobacteria bacterium]|nr:redoxin domain-containing protein [Alphaproteobacteria bacterium]